MLYERLTANDNAIIDILRKDYDSCENSSFFKGEYVDNQTFLRYWETAKAPLAQAFGDNLIVRKPVNASIEDEELHSRMNAVYWMNEFSEVKRAISNMLKEHNEEIWNAHIHRQNGDIMTTCEVIRWYLFDEDALVTNRYEGPTCELRLPDGNMMKLSNGCKVMKAIGRLAKACSQYIANMFEIVRLRQSQILNDARITADLCISIHPIDYMTASYNNNDWRSCMCWVDGEYRRGVIEMMNSPMVVVAYIASKSQELTWHNWNNNKLAWNSKKWREFFIVTPELISGIKGYPYWNRALEDTAIEMLRDMFAPVFKTKYAPKIYHWHTDDTNIVDMSANINVKLEMDCGPAMYNDFYREHEYHTILAEGLTREHGLSIFYSGPTECVVCGNTNDMDFDDSGEGEIVCQRCVTRYSCCKCGDTITNSEFLFEVGGNYYCQYCYDNLPQCDCCDNAVDPDCDEETIQFCVAADEVVDNAKFGEVNDVLRERPDFNEDYDTGYLALRRICADCAETIFKDGREEFYKHHLRHYERWHYFDVVRLSHLTEAGLKLFSAEDLNYYLEVVKKHRQASA